MVIEANESNSPASTNESNQSSTDNQGKDKTWWIRVCIYAIFVLFGETVATLLGRLYYDKGGNSKWMATLVQIAGFPILLPYYCFTIQKNPTTITTSSSSSSSSSIDSKPLSSLTLSSVYISLGLLNAAVCLSHSLGLFYLPVSTYSLICATQLSFSAFFSFFLNSQKLTAYIVNSLVLLTISSTLLLFQADLSNQSKILGRKYIIGFICTICASAGFGLSLSLTQCAMQKVLKRETFSAIMDMTVYQSLVATCATLVGLFVSGDWKSLRSEMLEFDLGKVSYVMTLTWAAISWQLFSIGSVGLILEVSSLFSNVMSVLSLPVVPVLSVIFFHDEIDGVKVISMVLAIWGFVSYVYQHYLDNRRKPKVETQTYNNEETASEEDISNGSSVVQFEISSIQK
ncbi:hypothetical protein UlMin_018856 [Ulmus minor]